MYTLTKQKTDPKVKRYLDLWEGLSDDGKFALDMAVYDMLVMDIDLHRKEILQEAERLHKAHVSKVYRAAAKTVIKHRKGEHDQKDHGNWAKQTASFVSEALGREKGPEQLALFGPDTPVKQKDGQWKIIASLSALPERLTAAGEKVAEGMKEFLKGSTWGERILSGAAYLARGTSLVAEAAKALVVYGPVAGARMIAAYFRYGGYDVPVQLGGEGNPPKRGRNKDGTPRTDEQYRELSRTTMINKLRKELPDRATMELSAGKAPSEGYIISKSGEVIAHAVGRGNDHYLPFGLKHLRMLRKEEGGEIVRRRALGGVTVEDIHAATLLGADKVTVVSQSGVFTLDLTDRAKGLRSEHTQILSRYQDLLRREARGRNGDQWNFATYNNAMKALALEFPLHFDVRENTAGDHPSMGDRNHPKKSIIQEFRDMFGADSKESGQYQTEMSASSVRREYADIMGKAGLRPPSRMNYEEARQWFIDNATTEQKRRYNSLVNPKTEPDNTRQKAGKITPSKPVGYTTPPREDHRQWKSADSVVRTFDETPRRDNPVTVRQTEPTRPMSNDELRQRQAEVRSKLDEEIAEYAAANDPAIAWMQAHGYDPDVDNDERERVLDAADYAEDDAGWPYRD